MTATSQATPKIILDPSQFVRVEFETKKGKIDRKATHRSLRIPIPLEIQAMVNTALKYDYRRQGAKPTELDLYAQLVEAGYQTVEASLRDTALTGVDDSHLTVPTVDKTVVWLEKDLSDKVRLQFSTFNIERQTEGKARIRAIEGYIIALMRLGTYVANVKTL